MAELLLRFQDRAFNEAERERGRRRAKINKQGSSQEDHEREQA